MRKPRRTATASLPVALALLVVGITPSLAMAATCKPATNIEAIVDDSGSMLGSDSNRLRVQGMGLLIDSLPAATRLGAVEFGSGFGSAPAAATVFKPEPVGTKGTQMKQALNKVVKGDNGATDYNAAFALAATDNPNAQARIFLTDGGHNVDEYANGHLTPNVPTYVVGFGSGLVAPSDQERLQRIADETGGSYSLLTDSSQLQAVINSIGAALSCQTPPRTFTDNLGQGQSKTHAVPIGAATKAIQIALTWANPLDRFRLSNLRLVLNGKPIAVAPRTRQPRKLKVKRTGSTTFSLIKVSGLSKGRLSFKVKATKIGSGEPKVSLTTQVSQRARR